MPPCGIGGKGYYINIDNSSVNGVKDHPEGTRPWQREYRNDAKLWEAVSRIAASLLGGGIGTREELQSVKLEIAGEMRLSTLPTNSMILDRILDEMDEVDPELLILLRKKPSRTLSGVAVVAVMTSPHDCPHGKCIFCPGGTDWSSPTPQSYTGREPAAMRAIANEFDPYRQTLNRIRQLQSVGHPTDKIDLILMGGTITARDPQYQESFVKGCLDAMNERVSKDLISAQEANEKASRRCIGMTFETRPDYLGREECDRILTLGGTRVEIGVQSTFDEPLILSGRGHLNRDTREATMTARDSGLKIGYHLMPGLPGSDMKMDVESARRAFTDEGFMPDMIKIYPTLVVSGTRLFDMWKKGEYEPLDTERAAEVVARIKMITPPWVRIQRVQRDIPTNMVDGGVDMSNLRQVAAGKLEKMGGSCRCIRCREVGHRIRDGSPIPRVGEEHLERREYDASEGREVFLSFEHEGTDSLLGYLRLRRPSVHAHREEVEGAAIVRELKVLGQMVRIGSGPGTDWQHRGLGMALLREAENIAESEWSMDRILVMSGIGAREYYRKEGYTRVGPYMGREL